MKKCDRYIMERRWRMYDLFESVICDIVYDHNFTISHQSDFSVFWIYFNHPSYYRVVTFPADILYINIAKGVKGFLDYIEGKIEGIRG